MTWLMEESERMRSTEVGAGSGEGLWRGIRCCPPKLGNSTPTAHSIPSLSQLAAIFYHASNSKAKSLNPSFYHHASLNACRSKGGMGANY